jgi:hypothetical protein
MVCSAFGLSRRRVSDRKIPRTMVLPLRFSRNDLLCLYLDEIMDLQDQKSNIVYVVSLGNRPWKWSPLTPIEFVTKEKIYFHPYGLKNRWPTTPPNYLGFRYGGRLQSIHHVESCEPVKDLSLHVSGIDRETYQRTNKRATEPHLLYKLGPSIIPAQQVKKGKIHPAAHVKAALDLLLTCSTVSEARDRTNDRMTALSKKPPS